MQSTLFFILSLLLVSTYSTFLKSAPKVSDSHTILAELDRNHFGSSILSTVSIHMSTEAPIEEVDQLLNDIKKGVEQDQSTDDQLNTETQATCTSTIADYNNNIIFHDSGVKSNTDLLERTTNLLRVANENLVSTNSDINSNAQRFAEGESTRNQQHADYLQKVTDHKEAIEAIDQATELVKHLQHGSLFVQLKSKFAQISETLSKHKSRHALYSPIIMSLANLASKADQETVKKILNLLANLKTALEESQSTDTATENQQAADWVTLSTDLINEKKSLTERKAGLEADILSYQGTIAEAESNIKYHGEQLETNKKLLADETVYCNKAAADYAANTVERSREIEILGKVIDHLREKLGGIQDYLKERVNVDF